MIVEQTIIMNIFLLLALCAVCAADYEPVPNILTAMTGYNIFKGNPIAQSQGMLKDPGFTNMEYIFVPTEKRDNDKESLADGLTIRTIKSFMTSLESEVIRSTKDYRKYLEKEMSSGTDMATNLEYDVKVKVPLKGAEAEVGTKVPPLAAAAFGADSSFRKNERFFTSKQGIVVIAKAHCVIYTVKVSQTRPPKFHPGFIEMLKELQEATDGDEDDKDAKLKKLINNFGTHYMINVDMGARIAITKRFDKEETQKSTEEDMKECTKSSLNLFFGLVNDQKSQCEKKIESKDTSWTKEYSREYVTSFGSKPKKDLLSWADQEFDSPIPVKMTLDPIVNLFRKNFMKDLKDGDEKVDIDYKAILKWLLPKYLNYCQDHKSEMNIGSCQGIDQQAKRCGVNDDCEIDQKCLNIGQNGYICNNPTRWYKVITETSNINWAGTNSDVFITLVDVNNRYSWEFELDNHYDNFEVGGKAPQDLFEISTNQRLGELKKIIIRTVAQQSHPGWHLAQVKVKDVMKDRDYVFPVGQWLYSGTYNYYEKDQKSEWNGKKKKFEKIKRE